MNTSTSQIVDRRPTDPLDQLIFEGGLRIKSIWFDKDLDVIVLLLNNKKVLQRPISDFPRLKGATLEQLHHYSTDGIGIRWEEHDEDLSLRGFLKYELSLMKP